MVFADFKIRIIANACMTRYDKGERPLISIVMSYPMSAADQDLVLAYIYQQRPELQ